MGKSEVWWGGDVLVEIGDSPGRVDRSWLRMTRHHAIDECDFLINIIVMMMTMVVIDFEFEFDSSNNGNENGNALWN